MPVALGSKMKVYDNNYKQNQTHYLERRQVKRRAPFKGHLATKFQHLLVIPGVTADKPGIYGLAFTMGIWFLTDNSATVGRILMIFSAHPHEISILIKW